MPDKFALSRRSTLALMAGSAFAAAALPGTASVAQSAVLTHRINLAGRQRMLTQRISRAVFFAALEADRTKHLEMLKRAHSLFDRTLKGLRSGDTNLELEAETHQQTLEALTAVDAIWAAFDLTVKDILARGNIEDQEIESIARLNPTLLDLSNKVVTTLTHQKGQTADDLGKTVALNVAARQRMLTQKMAKEVALLVIGFEPDESHKALQGTRDIFDASHQALLNGLPSIQLPPPSPAVRAKLAEADGMWDAYRSTINRVIETGIASTYDLSSISVQADVLLAKMNEAVLEF